MNTPDLLVDIPFWNLVLGVILGVEASLLFMLGWTRPKISKITQKRIGLGVVVLFAYLGVDTSIAQVIQVATNEVLAGLSVVTFIAILLRFAILVGLSTYLWHEWKEPIAKELDEKN